MKTIFIAVIFTFNVAACAASSITKLPDCSGVNSWATNKALVHLKNAGITNSEKLEFSKTKTSLIASEATDEDLYRQVHLINFFEKSGTEFKVITVNDASNEECSMSGVEVFLVEKQIGDDVLKQPGIMMPRWEDGR